MNIPQFSRYSEDLWNYHVNKLNRNNLEYDQYQQQKVKKNWANTERVSYEHHHKHVKHKDHVNDLKLLGDYYLLAENRNKRSLNNKMNRQFYMLGTHIDIKL